MVNTNKIIFKLFLGYLKTFCCSRVCFYLMLNGLNRYQFAGTNDYENFGEATYGKNDNCSPLSAPIGLCLAILLW